MLRREDLPPVRLDGSLRRWLTRVELADVLGVCTRSVWRWQHLFTSVMEERNTDKVGPRRYLYLWPEARDVWQKHERERWAYRIRAKEDRIIPSADFVWNNQGHGAAGLAAMLGWDRVHLWRYLARRGWLWHRQRRVSYERNGIVYQPRLGVRQAPCMVCNEPFRVTDEVIERKCLTHKGV